MYVILTVYITQTKWHTHVEHLYSCAYKPAILAIQEIYTFFLLGSKPVLTWLLIIKNFTKTS